MKVSESNFHLVKTGKSSQSSETSIYSKKSRCTLALFIHFVSFFLYCFLAVIPFQEKLKFNHREAGKKMAIHKTFMIFDTNLGIKIYYEVLCEQIRTMVVH